MWKKLLIQKKRTSKEARFFLRIYTFAFFLSAITKGRYINAHAIIRSTGKPRKKYFSPSTAASISSTGFPSVLARKKKFVPSRLLRKYIGMQTAASSPNIFGRRRKFGLNPSERSKTGYMVSIICTLAEWKCIALSMGKSFHVGTNRAIAAPGRQRQ